MPTRSAAGRHIAPTFVVVLVAGVLVVGALVAPAYGNRSHSDDDDPRAVALLHRAMDATDRLAYAGTQYVSAWSVLDRSYSTSAIVQVRHSAGTTTLFTDQGAQPVTLTSQGGSWLAGEGGPIGLLAKAYDVELLGKGQVAGRPADVVGARRSDGSLAARLWLDAEHALALRREVYDEAGRTISASTFVEIDLAAAAQWRYMSMSPRAFASTAGLVGSASRLSHADLAALRSGGWRCPSELGGGLVLFEASRHDAAVQLSYSDGVATVSVFEQPGQLDPTVLEGFSRTERGDGVVYTLPGPPSKFVWSTDEKVITVIADGSLEAVDAVLAEYPPSEPSSPNSVVHRISRGAKKLVSWLNPFD